MTEKKTTTATTGTQPLDIGELTIILRIRNFPIFLYIGTRMQLEAEGIIPHGTIWPDGFRKIQWAASNLLFELGRQRPKNTKGPRRDFIDCDNWQLRVKRPDWNWPDEHLRLTLKKAERLRYQRSEEGRAESNRLCALYCAAQSDEKFQMFKALIPALTTPRRKP
jgi:hypothetical protein